MRWTARDDERVELRTPSCERCARARRQEAPPDAVIRDLPRIATPEELEAWPNLTKATAQTHGSEPSMLQAVYEFERDVACSLPRRHRHRKGMVVGTYCGLILKIGRRCGKLQIAGFKSIELFANNVRDYQARRSFVQREPQALLDELNRLQPEIDRLYHLRQRLAPFLANEMRGRARGGASARTVYVEATTVRIEGKRKEGGSTRDWAQRNRELVGLDFWLGENQAAAARSLSRELERFVERVSASELAPMTVNDFARDLTNAANKVAGLRRWLDAGYRFRASANVELAGIAAELQHFQVDGNAVRVPGMIINLENGTFTRT